MKYLKLFAFMVYLLPLTTSVKAQEIVNLSDWGVSPNTFRNSSPQLRAAIESCRGKTDVVLRLPGGRIDLWPEGAFKEELYISNTTENDTLSKVKNIAFWLEDLENFTIQGNNTLIMLHGKMVSFAMVNSKNITIENLSFDYERPTMSELTIRSVTDKGIETEIHPDSRYVIENEQIVFYGEGWKSNSHHTILFRPESETMVYSSFRPFIAAKAVQLAPFIVKFEGNFSGTVFRPGDVLTVRDPYRDNCGGFINLSKNIRLKNLNMHFIHGMGIVSQFSENIEMHKVTVAPRKESGRVIAAFADCFHFSGCKGLISIDSCYTSGTHDDPVNVHGTHLKITGISESGKLTVRFMHHQTYGFEAFFAGDSIALINAPTLQPMVYAKVKTAKLINLREMELELEEPLPKDAAIGQVIENITWTPEVRITNNHFERTNTRGVLITTRRSVLIENNHFSRMGMHAILIANDASSWYESGPVHDVTIRSNLFENCGYNSAPNNYIIAIAPENHESVDGFYVHRNILIENNTFNIYDTPLVTARSTDNLSFVDNTVVQRDYGTLAKNSRPAFYLSGCKKVNIDRNRFDVVIEPEIRLNNMKKRELISNIKHVTIQ
jgi:hypothetical protein